MYKVRLMRWNQRVHTALLRQMISLAGIAGAARGHHVGPVVVASPRERDQVIPSQALPVPQLQLASVAILAAVEVAGEQEGVGDLAAKAAGNVNEFDESYDCWFRQCQAFASDVIATVRFDDFGFALDHKTKSAPDRYHRQRFEGGV